MYLLGHLSVASVHLFSQSLSIVLQYGGLLLNVFRFSSAAVFSGQAVLRSDFLVVESLTSCCSNVYVEQGYYELESLFVQ